MKALVKTVVLSSLFVSSFATGAMAGGMPKASVSISVGSLYQSDDESIDALSNLGYTGISLNNDDKNVAVKLAYQKPITDHWGVEIAYVDLGKIDFVPQLTSPVGTSDAQAAQDVVDSLPLRGRGFTLKGTHTFALGKSFTAFSLLANAGISVLKDEVAATVGTSSASNNNMEVGVVVGASGAFRLSQQMKLVLDWDHYVQKHNDSDVVSLGIRYAF